MRKVGIPRSLPYFFGSLKVAITLAFVGTVISESVASNNGIGNLMLQAQAQFQVPLIFAGLIALAVEGIVMYWVMAVLERRMTGHGVDRWQARLVAGLLDRCDAAVYARRYPEPASADHDLTLAYEIVELGRPEVSVPAEEAAVLA